ncbi:hypothetical protein [Bordetella sp. BOR01]|uniref:hypothetical protein n=1 Tax=Bordetella sp. BOR01 TaxID=2854779 RepID=UPI001C45FB52|nr:hypothetical protein [Bordetella sp. BOR01]MBV7482837.1 hypothetical protein [Bordetella sp. BOR01]
MIAGFGIFKQAQITLDIAQIIPVHMPVLGVVPNELIAQCHCFFIAELATKNLHFAGKGCDIVGFTRQHGIGASHCLFEIVLSVCDIRQPLMGLECRRIQAQRMPEMLAGQVIAASLGLDLGQYYPGFGIVRFQVNRLPGGLSGLGQVSRFE